MTVLTWDTVGGRQYQTGVSKGVLYIPDSTGAYINGYAWNGLTGVTEAPSGAAPTPKYADNIKYLNLISTEEFAGTIEAYMYPDAFAQCDGTATPTPGVYVTQQSRKTFGLSYRTQLGNDVAALDYGYKLHLVYGALAEPSQKAYATVNDTPEAIVFQWKFSTTPVAVTGLKNSALIVIDSTKVDATALGLLEQALYGTSGASAYLPSPDAVIAFFSGTVTTVVTASPTFVAGTGVITIPTIAGVQFKRADTGVNVANGSTVTIATSGASLVIQAVPLTGYIFSPTSDADWTFTRS